MNTDTIADLTVEVDYRKSLSDMIAAGNYDWVNPNITLGNFPVEGTGKKAFHTKLFQFDRYISSDDAVAAMKKENFTPANHVHGLAFGAAFPDEQRKYPIACLGSSALVDGVRGVACLDRYGNEGRLFLGDWDGGCGNRWRFPGVQEKRGQHSQSMDPSRPIKAALWQSPIIA
jgi:hypothetical protein